MAEDVMDVEVLENGDHRNKTANTPELTDNKINKETVKSDNLFEIKSTVPNNGVVETQHKASGMLKDNRLISALSFDINDSSSFKVLRNSESKELGIESKVQPPVMENDLFNNYKKAPVRPVFHQKHSSKFNFEDSLGNTIAPILPDKSACTKSAFRRKLNLPSPIANFNSFDDDNVLKRCNSAPMLNDISDHEDYIMPWTNTGVQTVNSRLRRFSATIVSSVNSSPSNVKPSSRLNQLKKEESLEAIQFKETAREREVQVTMQMNSTCGELSLNDSQISGVSSTDNNNEYSSKFVVVKTTQSPQPVQNKSINRSIDFGKTTLPIPQPQTSTVCIIPPSHHTISGIPSPLLIHPFGHSISPMPPSPTRSMGLQTKGKQCFSPSMQLSGLRDGSLSPSPSPTRRSFLTRRRSQSPCLLRPSALGPIKRKYDSDSEGCSSPKRMVVSTTTGAMATNNNSEQNHYPQKTVIHRSHSLSSSSVDSHTSLDFTNNISPSPPPIFHNNFLPSLHLQHRRNTSSPIQSPLCNPSLTVTPNSVPGHERCVSPSSSTCSNSSLEGINSAASQIIGNLGNTSLQNKNKNLASSLTRVQPQPSNFLS